MVPKVETSPLAVGFASKLAPTGHFFGVEHVLIPSKLTLVNGYVLSWMPFKKLEWYQIPLKVVF